MRLNEFLKWFWDRLWLFALAGLVVGGATYVVVARRPPAYEAKVMMVVGGYMQAPNPDTTEIRTGVELARTYAVLATTHNVLRDAVAAADFPLAPDRLAELVDTEVRSDTSILELSVTYTDAEQAAAIANAIAQQLIVQSPTNLTPEQQQQLDMAYAQIDRLNRQLERARAEADALDQSLADEGAMADLEPFERTLLLEQQERLANQINQLTASLAEFLAVAAGLQERTNALEIVEWARTPTTPVNTNIWVITLFGAMVGVVLIAGLVFIVEYLDDAIWVPDAAVQALGLPVLAVIPKFGEASDSPAARLIVAKRPTDPVSDNFHALRAHLQGAAGRSGGRIVVFTSADAGAGKSVTVGNVAVAMAEAGLRVLLVDADLRNPTLHQFFGLHNEVGLTTLLAAGAPAPAPSLRLESDAALRRCVQEPAGHDLRVLTSGVVTANPTSLLGSPRMQAWCQALRRAEDVDVILFDTPASALAPDSAVLAEVAGASVVLVLRAGMTTRQIAAETRAHFAQFGLEIAGVVLNFVRRDDLGTRYRSAVPPHPANSAVSEGRDPSINRNLSRTSSE